MIQCWGQTEAPASTTLLDARRDAAARAVVLDRAAGPGRRVLRAQGRCGARPPRARGRRRAGHPHARALPARCWVPRRSTRSGSWPTGGGGPPTSVTSTTPGGSTSWAARARRSSRAARTSSLWRSSAPTSRMSWCARPSWWGSQTTAGVRHPRRTSTFPTSATPPSAELDVWVRDRLAGFKRPGHVFLSSDPIPACLG